MCSVRLKQTKFMKCFLNWKGGGGGGNDDDDDDEGVDKTLSLCAFSSQGLRHEEWSDDDEEEEEEEEEDKKERKREREMKAFARRCETG